MNKGWLVELRNNLILLEIASTHKYVGIFIKHSTHEKKGGMKEKRSKTSPFCRQASPRDLHHYESPENRRKHKAKFFFRGKKKQ